MVDRIRLGDLERWTVDVLAATGASADAAATTARHLVSASRRGLDSHGVVLLRLYLPRLRSGAIDGAGRPRIVLEQEAAAVVDGDRALGAFVADYSMRLCCEKALRHGTAAVVVRESSHFGAASCYAELAAEAGCVGMAFSNSDPGMAPLGARGPVLGTNPLAIAGPCGAGSGMPSLDIATSVVAQGRVKAALRAGRTIPPNWALGPDGVPTTDPALALQGTLLPMGDHKGFALAFMIDLLAGCLSGANLSPEIESNPESSRPLGTGHCFIALNVEAFAEPRAYEASLDRLVDAVHSAARTPGTKPFLVPGELEARVARERADGIPIDVATRQLLQELGSEFGVPFEIR